MERPEIRLLDAEKIPLAGRLGLSFFADTGAPGTFRPEVFTRFWRTFYEQGVGRMYGAFVDGEHMRQPALVGAVGGLVAPDVCTGEPRCTEMFWWLDPEFRSGRTALRLFEALEGWAVERDCEAITFMYLSSAGNGATLDKWYRRRGYEPLEAHYIRRLRC